MAEYQVGDRVRVTYEGVVEAQCDHQVRLSHAVVPNLWLDLHDATTVEVIWRRKKVGDIVEGEAEYAALPVGSVVKAFPGLLFRTERGWTDLTGRDFLPDDFYGPRTLVYLPES